jgi:hypothetical protein
MADCRSGSGVWLSVSFDELSLAGLARRANIQSEIGWYETSTSLVHLGESRRDQWRMSYVFDQPGKLLRTMKSSEKSRNIDIASNATAF